MLPTPLKFCLSITLQRVTVLTGKFRCTDAVICRTRGAQVLVQHMLRPAPAMNETPLGGNQIGVFCPGLGRAAVESVIALKALGIASLLFLLAQDTAI